MSPTCRYSGWRILQGSYERPDPTEAMTIHGDARLRIRPLTSDDLPPLHALAGGGILTSSSEFLKTGLPEAGV